MDIVYLNGDYVRWPDAKTSLYDRGLLFSDAVYEMVSIDGAGQVAEAFISSSTLLVMPVIEFDRHRIGDGRSGEQAGKIRQSYLAAVQTSPSTTN